MTPADAFSLLRDLGPPPRLMTHVRLVGEAGDLLLVALARLGAALDADFVRAGIVLHDAGKVRHPEELTGRGKEHEPSGEQLLLERGVDPRLARVCRSHGSWESVKDCSYEELVIALADRLWKGVRSPQLEERFIDETAARLARDRWDLFVALDDAFESIAAGGAERLERSRTG
ncbi:MAG: HD domain-containing protein [Deltaproteobacteria bacterium]